MWRHGPSLSSYCSSEHRPVCSLHLNSLLHVWKTSDWCHYKPVHTNHSRYYALHHGSVGAEWWLSEKSSYETMRHHESDLTLLSHYRNMLKMLMLMAQCCFRERCLMTMISKDTQYCYMARFYYSWEKQTGSFQIACYFAHKWKIVN